MRFFRKRPSSSALSASAPTLYVALLTAAPTNASTGATITEANYTGYARVATTGSSWNASTGTSPATVSNSAAITFPACTGSTSTVTYFALLDSATLGAGNMICWGALSSSLAISNGITPSFAGGSPGQLTVTVD